MLWFLFFGLLLGIGAAKGEGVPTVFIAWCVLVYYLFSNGYIK
ncbi:hypothetical protein [Veillonella caviae]|nr:hypothetical protein [Veillonella caviae]MDY4746491.1 hypothetical protein [Veillonella caviae]